MVCAGGAREHAGERGVWCVSGGEGAWRAWCVLCGCLLNSEEGKERVALEGGIVEEQRVDEDGVCGVRERVVCVVVLCAALWLCCEVWRC